MDNRADNTGKPKKQSKSDKRDSRNYTSKKRTQPETSGDPGEDSKKLCVEQKRLCRETEESKALVAHSAVAAPSAEEATAAEGEVLAAAETEAMAGMAEAVVAAVDAAAAASGGGSDEAPVADETDPQDNVAAEGKSKRTVAAMLGYGHATNLISGDASRHYVHYPHHYHQHQPQYSQPAPQQQQYQQYHTLRYYPSKAAAEQAASVPSGGRPHYQIQYTAYVPPQASPSAAAAANPAVHYAQSASAQQLVQVAPVPAASQQIVAFQQPAHPALYAQQQLIPVIIVRVADPAQHGLATAALLPASALGLSALPALQGLQALQGLHTPATLQGLLLGHYMQQAVAAAQQAQQQQQVQQAPAAQAYYSADPTPQLTQQQLKQLYAQQQAAVAASSEIKKPVAPSAPQKARKGSVTIEPAQSVDNTHTQYKYSTFKDKN